jgi:MoaA/NifB/PqqE/SkfB family radical SAM enzyme
MFGMPKILPMNLVVSVTYRCNSRCKTCNIYKKKADEFSIEEFNKTFHSFGHALYWVTLSGGEPFLRQDIVQICQSLYQNCRPRIINIPTNGLLSDIIFQKTEEILKSCPKSQVIINLSIDGIGKQHDEIRNVRDGFSRVMKTYNSLKILNYPNFTLGVHIVISKFNVNQIPEIYQELEKMNPDSIITEVAEQRVELDTMEANITPSLEDYSKVVDFLCEKLKKHKSLGISKVTKAFRLQYYRMAKETLLKKRQIIPCYAGFNSAHIAPDGDVWSCCIKAEPVGNLRQEDYNFKKIWLSKKIAILRRDIKKGKCYCPMANVSYTNMLCHYGTLVKVGINFLKG